MGKNVWSFIQKSLYSTVVYPCRHTHIQTFTVFSFYIHIGYLYCIKCIDFLFLLSFPSYLQALCSSYPSVYTHWFQAGTHLSNGANTSTYTRACAHLHIDLLRIVDVDWIQWNRIIADVCFSLGAVQFSFCTLALSKWERWTRQKKVKCRQALSSLLTFNHPKVLILLEGNQCFVKACPTTTCLI